VSCKIATRPMCVPCVSAIGLSHTVQTGVALAGNADAETQLREKMAGVDG